MRPTCASTRSGRSPADSSPAEARRAAFALVPAEGVLAWLCGTRALVAWAAVLVWTLLMYREFFVGAWLRPRMELYAVTHTFVVTGLGLLAAVTVGGATTQPFEMLLAPAAANWAVFNVFEFARKTLAPEEERPGVETYSSRHGPRGALLLTAGNVLVACAALAFGGVLPRTGLCAAAAAALLPLFGTVPFALRPEAATARWFRGCHGAFLVAFYAAVLVGTWQERGA
jgi:4-hydroxybenzoate polyprenyltransferase